LRMGQYLAIGSGARALKTGNNLGCIQVEIGGKAAQPFTDPNVFRYSDKITAGVVALFQAMQQKFPAMQNHVDSRVKFRGDVCAGFNSPCRVSQQDFIDISGLIGHAQAPGNDHWDPGAIDPNRLLTGGPVAPGVAPAPMASTSSTSSVITCTDASGNPGYCTDSSTCNAISGTLHSSSSGAQGCGALASSIQCCSSGNSAAPTLQACSYGSATGSCLSATTCSQAHGFSRRSSSKVTGCEQLPSGIQCCLPASSGLEDGFSMNGGTLSGAFNTALIAGVAVAALVVIGVIVGVVICCVVRRRNATRTAGGGAISFSNTAYSPDAAPPIAVTPGSISDGKPQFL